MKSLCLNRVMLSTVFIFGLTASQSAFASPKDFILESSNNSNVGQGYYESAPYSKAKVVIKLNNSEYVGVGQVNKNPAEFVRAMQSNRGTIAAKPKKRVSLDLVNTDGEKLTCELNILYSKFWGHCFDAHDQQTLLIKPSIS